MMGDDAVSPSESACWHSDTVWKRRNLPTAWDLAARRVNALIITSTLTVKVPRSLGIQA